MIIDKFSRYTWKDEWIRPYESFYSILSKFKAVNVLSDTDLTKVFGIPRTGASARLQFYDDFFMFNNVPVRIDCKPYNKIVNKLDVFRNLDKIINTRICYCPECIQKGYHSILHQLTFIDDCPIHNIPLQNMCECEENYVIMLKREIPAYQCVCGKKLEICNIHDFIIDLWKEQLPFPKIEHSNINEIHVLDYYNYSQNRGYVATCELSDNLKAVLKDLYFRGFTDVKPSFTILNDDVKEPLFMPQVIHDFMVKTYGVEECEKNYFLLIQSTMPNITDEFLNKYNLDIISIILLLKELLAKSRIDLIYPVKLEYGFGEDRDISEYSSFLKYELKGVCYAAKNYIYETLLMDRLSQIKNFMIQNNVIPRREYIINEENRYTKIIVIKDADNQIYIYK